MRRKLLITALTIGGILVLTKISHAYPFPLKNKDKLIQILRYKYHLTQKQIDTIIELLPYIIEVSHKYGIDPSITLAVILQESRGNPIIVSWAGAIGLMQIMPSTARKICGLSKEELFNPYKNIECGVKYLAYLKKKAEYIKDFYAGYYAGEKAILYRKSTGRYPSYGKPPVYKVVEQFYDKYSTIKRIGVA